MRLYDLGPVWLTLIGSLLVTVVLLAIRVFVMMRVQQRRQRENRQEAERLRSLVAVYRSLAGTFTAGTHEQSSQIEEALSDVVLFGSLRQVELAAACINRLKAGEPPDCQALVEDLRRELRTQLGLEPLPLDLKLPPSGPGRTARTGRGEGGGARAGGGGAGGGGGGGLGAGAAGGALGGVVGAGAVASDGDTQQP